jgi:hypothetical protein
MSVQNSNRESVATPLDPKDLVDFRPEDIGHRELNFQPSTDLSSSNSFTSTKGDLSTLEKQNPWDGYLEDVLPEKGRLKPLRNMRYIVFIIYRRLFGLVFVTNMAIFVAFLVKGRTSSQELAQIVVANLFCAILMRQEYVINTFFVVFCAVPITLVFLQLFCRRLLTLRQVAAVYSSSVCEGLPLGRQ